MNGISSLPKKSIVMTTKSSPSSSNPRRRVSSKASKGLDSRFHGNDQHREQDSCYFLSYGLLSKFFNALAPRLLIGCICMWAIYGTEACSSDIPCPSNVRIRETKTTPLSTAIPNNAMKPTLAEILKGSPRIHKAKIPPDRAKGTFKKMRKAGRSVPNMRESIPMIKSNVTGTMRVKR